MGIPTGYTRHKYVYVLRTFGPKGSEGKRGAGDQSAVTPAVSLCAGQDPLGPLSLRPPPLAPLPEAETRTASSLGHPALCHQHNLQWLLREADVGGSGRAQI